MQEVLSERHCSLKIKLDMKTIKKLQLEVDLESVRFSILKASKLKINASV